MLLLVLVLRSFLFEPYQIPSESMVPTLEVGDFILVNKYAYGIRLPVLGTKLFDVGEPQHGDVMVFVPPHEPRYFIKRVIGVPGDRVRYQDKVLYINGARVPQEFVDQVTVEGRPYIQIYDEQLGHSYTSDLPVSCADRAAAGVDRAGGPLLHDGRQSRSQ